MTLIKIIAGTSTSTVPWKIIPIKKAYTELFLRNGRLLSVRVIPHRGFPLSTEVEKYFRTRHPATEKPQNDCVRQDTNGTPVTCNGDAQETIGTSKSKNDGAEPGNDGKQETGG